MENARALQKPNIFWLKELSTVAPKTTTEKVVNSSTETQVKTPHEVNYNVPLTSIRKVHVLLLPLLSTASHVTNVCPIVNPIPGSGSQVTSSLSPELSVAEGCCQTASAVGWPGWVFNVWLSGHISNSGASLSKIRKSNYWQREIHRIHIITLTKSSLLVKERILSTFYN